jgi:hypothetical protein
LISTPHNYAISHIKTKSRWFPPLVLHMTTSPFATVGPLHRSITTSALSPIFLGPSDCP